MAAAFQNLRATARRFFVWAAAALAAGSAEARLVEITVLNTTDLHGAICRSPGVYAERNEGSLLQ